MFTRNTIGGLLVVARVEVSFFPPIVHVSEAPTLISRIFNVNPLI
jgi:hypothetical protein